MFKYELYGKTIESNVKLSLTKSTKVKSSIIIRYCPKKISDRNNLWKFDSSIILVKKNNSYFLWIKGSLSKHQLTIAISNVILPHILSLKGELVVHGSCVSLNDKGIVFAGLSGVGKSSIAYLAQSKNFSLVSDDKILLQKKTGAVSILGGDHKIKLVKKRTSARVIKKSISVSARKSKTKLSSIFILTRSSKHKSLRLKKLNGTNKFQKMLPHILVLQNSSAKSKSKVVNSAFETFHNADIWLVNYPHSTKNREKLLNQIKNLTEKK